MKTFKKYWQFIALAALMFVWLLAEMATRDSLFSMFYYSRGGYCMEFSPSSPYAGWIPTLFSMAALVSLTMKGLKQKLAAYISGGIAAVLALAHPERVRGLILGGIGQYLVDSVGLPDGLAEAMEAERIEDVESPMMKIFRGFAESTRSDLVALAACVRGARKAIDPARLREIASPVLICVGTRDDVAGSPRPLAPLFRDVRIIDIPDRDHNRAVGDRIYKQSVLEFLAARP